MAKLRLDQVLGAENAEGSRRLTTTRGLGDVCDPIPCARTEPEPTAKIDGSAFPRRHRSKAKSAGRRPFRTRGE